MVLHSGTSKKLFFHDDGHIRGTPEALGWASRFFDELCGVSGLKMKWFKTKCHAPRKSHISEQPYCWIIRATSTKSWPISGITGSPDRGEILIFRKVHKKSTDTSQIMPQPKTTQI